jgi:hypothetical protein
MFMYMRVREKCFQYLLLPQKQRDALAISGKIRVENLWGKRCLGELYKNAILNEWQ